MGLQKSQRRSDKTVEKSDISRGNNTSNSDSEDQNIGQEPSVEPSHPSHPSHDPNAEEENGRNLLLNQ
jgi:hypothetical protein